MKNEMASLNLYFRAAVERVELLSLELEARHEVVDDFHLGVRENRLIERNGLRNVVVKPEEGRDRSRDEISLRLSSQLE